MASLSWAYEKETSVDAIFRVWQASPLKGVYNFGEFVDKLYRQKGYRVI